MPAVLRTDRAEEDLLDIWAYIAQDSPVAADAFVDELVETCLTLAEHPAAGHGRPELAPDLRSFSHGNYIIFYRPIDNGVLVIRVLHGARDLTELF